MEANLKAYVIKAVRYVRGSFSAQLTLGVAGFVVAISAVVMAMLMRFSQEVIRDETLTATRQALENAALRIDNTQCPTYNGQYAVVIDIPAGDIDGRFEAQEQAKRMLNQ